MLDHGTDRVYWVQVCGVPGESNFVVNHLFDPPSVEFMELPFLYPRTMWNAEREEMETDWPAQTRRFFWVCVINLTVVRIIDLQTGEDVQKTYLGHPVREVSVGQTFPLFEHRDLPPGVVSLSWR